MTLRVIAIDWSGARTGAKNKIWVAEAADGRLLRLECGRSREETVRHLAALRTQGDPVVVGLDFGFSFPAWYMRERRFECAADAWRWLATGQQCDELLAACRPPFWGAPARPCPRDVELLRRTEWAVKKAEGVRPKSVFQVGGAGAVGTGSLRGMRALDGLRREGYAIWPFDDASRATVCEIYPRLFTGRVNKSDPEARRARLESIGSGLPRVCFDAAVRSDDAFDAAISAIEMSLHAPELSALPRVREPTLQLEGILWWPGWREAHGV
jgi:hypothetical protein